MKTASSNSLQFQLIEKIKEIISSNTSLADDLSEILGVSQDSIYRRIRGETALTIDEVYKICSHYKISFDALSLYKSESVSFKYKSIRFDEVGFKNYLLSILDHLNQLKKASTKQLIYLAEDMPIFYHYKYPELTAYKMFYWMKSVLNVPSFEGKKFEPAIVPQELIDIGKQIFEAYISVSSTEIWSETTTSSNLKQIEYYIDSGLFLRKEDARLICEQFIMELEHIQRQAELGTKFINESDITEQSAKYQLYNCEIEIGNNCIFIQTGNSKSVYLTHLTFNKLITTNPEFCDETEEWLESLTKKSILISGTSEKQRYQFFSKSLELANKLRNKIQ